MYTMYIILGVLSLLNLVSFIVFILVLIKSFTKGGALHGILGIITCGLYTFIWGWIKHKQAQLTKLMLLWTGILVAFIVLPIGAAFFGVPWQELAQVAQITKEVPQQVVKKPAKKPKKTAKKTTAKKTAKTSPGVKSKGTKQKDVEMEIRQLTKRINKNKKDTNALYDRAWLYDSRGQLDKAEQDYTMAIQANKKNENAYYNRGLVYVQMKQYAKAVEDFSQAISLNPRSVDAYCNRGNAHFELGNHEKAIKDLEAALRIAPRDADVMYNLGIVHAAKGDKTAADAYFKKAAKLGNKKAQDYLNKTNKTSQKKTNRASSGSGTDQSSPSGLTASGTIQGHAFSVEKAFLENNILTLRQGSDFFPDYGLVIFTFVDKEESIEGKVLKVGEGTGFNAPHIHVKWKKEGKKVPETKIIMKDYVMRLEFGKEQNGFIEGNIDLTLPDEFNTNVKGSFTAEFKG